MNVRVVLLRCVTVLGLGLLARGQTDDWPMFGHDGRRSNSSTSPVIPPLTEVATLPLPDGFLFRSGIYPPDVVMQSGKIFFAYSPTKRSGDFVAYYQEIVSLDEKTAKPLWSRRLEGIGNEWFSFASRGPLPSVDVVAGGPLYVASERNGFVTALNPLDGSIIWQSRDEQVNGSQWIVLAGDRLVVRSSDAIAAFRAADGGILWRRSVPRSGYQSMPVFTDGGVFFTGRSTLNRIEPTVGELVWTIGIPENGIIQAATSSRIIVSGTDTWPPKHATVSAFDTVSGRRAWNSELTGVALMDSAVSDAYILAETINELLNQSTITCLETETGRKSWELTFDNAQPKSMIVAGGKYLYVLLSSLAPKNEATLRAVEVTRGEIIWKHSFPVTPLFDPTSDFSNLSPQTNYSRLKISNGRLLVLMSTTSGAQYMNTLHVYDGQASGSQSSGIEKIISVEPSQPNYSATPDKDKNRPNLVVVTHGWQPALKPVDTAWVDEMTNAISVHLADRGMTDWQVHARKWEKKAHTPLPGAALNLAREEGVSLGKFVVEGEFVHVHLIAHSAGAALIQSACETVKSARPDIVMHLTFLDPFVGFTFKGRENYGKTANWADSYFSRDLETGGDAFPVTERTLAHSFNVDVTWLDTNKRKVQVVSSTSLGDVSQTCFETTTSHAWPYHFYSGTIPPNTILGAESFGFALSKEGGNWNTATNQYPPGKNALRVLGSGELSCIPIPSKTRLEVEFPQDFSKLPGASVLINAPEKVDIRGVDFTLKTASPAWLAATIPITNRVNVVFFEAAFTSANGAEGLVSVYWETNVIGSVDERMTLAGAPRYSFPIPEIAVSGTRTLGFRLDAFSGVPSSVTISNVALGFAGVKEPFSLSFAGVNTNGSPVLQLTGASGFNYALETSTNIIDWATVAILVNTNGTVRFVDMSADRSTAPRFYRAVAP